MPAGTPETTRSRSATAWNVILWVLQALLAAMFLFSGGMKLAGALPAVELFDQIGIGQWFRYVTGALEVIGAVALLIPRLVAFGALLLAVVMVGAVLTDLFVVAANPLPALVLLVLSAIIVWGRRDRLRLFG